MGRRQKHLLGAVNVPYSSAQPLSASHVCTACLNSWPQPDHLTHVNQSELSPESMARVGILGGYVNQEVVGWRSFQGGGCRQGRRKLSHRGEPVGLVLASPSLVIVLYRRLAALLPWGASKCWIFWLNPSLLLQLS